MTVLDLITRAMRLLGAIELGVTPDADEEALGLAALNALTDSFALERLMMWAINRNLYDLVAGQQVYQIGPDGPDWTAPRPAAITGAGLILGNADPTQTLERPLRILTDDEYRRIRIKGVTSTLPTQLYYDNGFANADWTGKDAPAVVGSANVFLWPAPTVINQVALYTPQQISQFTSGAQTIALPPGYARMLPYNLAVELAPELVTEPSQAVVAIAIESKENVQRGNFRPAKLRCKDFGSRGGAFDWMIGEER